MVLKISTIGGSIARVEMEFQGLQLRGWAQQTDREEISIPGEDSARATDSHLCDALSHSSLIISNALLLLIPTTPPTLLLNPHS